MSTMTIDCKLTVNFSLVVRKAMKLKLQREAQLPSVQVFMRVFRLVLLVHDITAMLCQTAKPAEL